MFPILWIFLLTSNFCWFIIRGRRGCGYVRAPKSLA
nr:MAG TPA: hypothetical protein [Caudoviricetes sp.]